MLKQISMVLAILCASITATIFPAMSEVNQPDPTAKEKLIENVKKTSKSKEINKNRGFHRHGDMRRKGRFGHDEQRRHKSRFDGRRHGKSDANYRRDGHNRKYPRREQRMSQNRPFSRDHRSSGIVKGKSGSILPSKLAKRLTSEQRQEVQQAVRELRQQHQTQMKSKIANLLKEYNIESPKPKGKKATVNE